MLKNWKQNQKFYRKINTPEGMQIIFISQNSNQHKSRYFPKWDETKSRNTHSEFLW